MTWIQEEKRIQEAIAQANHRRTYLEQVIPAKTLNKHIQLQK